MKCYGQIHRILHIRNMHCPKWQCVFVYVDVLTDLFIIVTVTTKNSKMKTTSTDRQQKHRQKMRVFNLTLSQVWVPKDRVTEIKSIAARMVEEGSSDLEPSQRQLSFAQFLCDKKGLKIPQEILSSSKRLSEWLNKNKKKADKD